MAQVQATNRIRLYTLDEHVFTCFTINVNVEAFKPAEVQQACDIIVKAYAKENLIITLEPPGADGTDTLWFKLGSPCPEASAVTIDLVGLKRRLVSVLAATHAENELESDTNLASLFPVASIERENAGIYACEDCGDGTTSKFFLTLLHPERDEPGWTRLICTRCCLAKLTRNELDREHVVKIIKVVPADAKPVKPARLEDVNVFIGDVPSTVT